MLSRKTLFLGITAYAVPSLAAPCLVLSDVATVPHLTAITQSCDNQVTVKLVNDTSVHLFEFGEPIYSNLLISLANPSNFAFVSPDDSEMLPESVKHRPIHDELQAAKLAEVKRPGLPGLGLTELIAFVDAGKNVLVTAHGGQGSSKDFDNLLAQFGMKFFSNSLVIDFFSPLTSSGPLKGEPWLELISGSKPVQLNQVSPIGIDINNENVFAGLRAASTAFHASSLSQGSALTLAACNQAANGARFAFVGAFALPDEFAKNIVSWTFGRRAVLRARDLYHHKVGEMQAPRMYKEKDEIEVGLIIEELREGKWTLFPATDVQIEYVMLDPYVRETMKFTGTGHRLTFTAPDVYGIFKFRLDYRRRGYNGLHIEQVAPVRNPRHNDYERFLICAYPYYASCFVTLGLVFVFALVFVNHKEVGKRVTGEKEARHRE